jgi:HEAT repeat protein
MRKRVVGNNPVTLRTPERQDQDHITTLAIPDSPPADQPKADSKSAKRLRKLAERNDDEAVAELAKAASSKDKQTQQLGRELLAQVLSRQGADALKDRLKDGNAVVRATAARIVGTKRLPLGAELIDLLSDDQADVRQAAHQALVRLNRGIDLGPDADAGESERSAAIKKWREWSAKQK